MVKPIAEIIDICVEIANHLILFASTILDVFTKSISEIAITAQSIAPDMIPDAFIRFLENSVIGDYTLLYIMLSSGITIYLMYQLFSWLLNIIT